MAKMKNGILSPISGKIGPIVTCTRKGIPYVKSKPTKVNHPNTKKQLAQRMRFSTIVKFLSPLKDFLAYTYAPHAIAKTGFNVAVSENMKSALAGTYPDIHIDYPGVVLSKGKLPKEENVVVEKGDNNDIKFSWTISEGLKYINKYDRVVTFIYNSLNADFKFFTDMCSREECEAIAHIPAEYHNYNFHCYIIFVTSDFTLGKISPHNISDSLYCGMIE